MFAFRKQANIYRSWKIKNKLSGQDGISNQLLKLSLPHIIDLLTYIFSLCVEKNIIPRELKKKQKWFLFQNIRTNPNNYRPISLLSVFSKLIETQVHIYLNDY